MPRALPWLQGIAAPVPAGSKTSENQKPKSKPSRSAPIKCQRSISTLSSKAEAESEASTDSDSDEEAKVKYMRPCDDKYIMVEDEFLTIAQSFTRTLHHQECDRLKSVANSKNARVISEIQRPVDGVTRMSKETVQKHQKIALSRAQAEMLKGDDSESEEEDPEKSVWGTSSLGVLMCSQKERDRNLVARFGAKSADTRAAAGLKKAELRNERRAKDAEDKRKPILPRPFHPEKPKSNTLDKSKMNSRENPKYSITKAPSEENTSSDDDDLDLNIICTNSKPPPSRTSIPSTNQSSNARSTTSPSSQPCAKPSAVSTSKPIPKIIPDAFDFDFPIFQNSQSSIDSYRHRSMAARRKEAEAKKLKGAEEWKKVSMWDSF
ncbi:hypothetical protein RUND412_007222 [Rhizina undulata]